MKKIMLIIIFLIPIFLILMVQLASVYIEKTHYIAVDRVSFPDSTYVIEKDTEDDVILEYEAKVYPVTATKKGIIYTSSDFDIATVDEFGTITFKDFGDVTITATSEVSTSIYDTCTFTVTDDVPHRMSIDNEIETLVVGEEHNLTSTIIPLGAINKTVTYTSSNPTIASVTSGGRIIALEGGKTTITGTTHNGISDSFVLEVLIPSESISIEGAKNLITGVNDAKFPNVIFTPNDCYDKRLTYSSSDESIATISEDGTINFKKIGEVTFAATSVEGGHTCTYTVLYTGGYFTKANILEQYKNIETEYEENKVLDIKYDIYPLNASLENITLISSDEDVIKIVNNQMVVVGGGSATITMQAKTINDSIITDTAKVFVYRGIEEIKANDVETHLSSEYLSKYITELLPSDHTDSVKYRLENNFDLATINETTGYIEFKQPGEVEVRIFSEKAYKIIKVAYIPTQPKHIEITEEDQTIEVEAGNRFGLLFDLELNMGLSTITVVEGNQVLELENGNVLRAIDGGIAKVTVTNGTKTIYVNVKVIRHADTINIESLDGKIEITLDQSVVVTGYKELYLTCEVLPNTTTDKSVTYSSSDETIAIVDENGIVTFLKQGKVTITAATENNKTSSVTIYSTYGYFNDFKLEQETFEHVYVENDENANKISIKVKSYQPNGADSSNIYYQSTNEEIATVDENGVVTILKGGQVTINVYALTDGETPILRQVNINCIRYATDVNVDEIVSKTYQVEFKLNKQYFLLPLDCKDTVRIETNSTLATYSNGLITFYQPGHVMVSIYSNGSNKLIKNVLVSYIPETYKTYTISEDGQEIEVEYGEEFILVFDPELGIGKYEPTIKNNSLITYLNSVFTGIDGGETEIEIGEITIKVKVIRHAESVSIKTLDEGIEGEGITGSKEIELIPTVLPNTTTDKSVTYSSSDETIAIVDENGIVTFLKQGEVTITVKTENGVTNTIKLHSTYGYLTDFELVETNIEHRYVENDKESNKVTISVTNLEPYNGDKSNISYESTNLGKATVDENGVVTILEGGEVVIKVHGEQEDGTLITKEVTIKVERYATSIVGDDINSNSKEVTLVDGNGFTMLPADNTDTPIVEVGSSLATYSSGKLVFSQPGIVNVTIYNSTKSVSKTIKVSYLPSGETYKTYTISEDGQEIEVEYGEEFILVFDPELGIGKTSYSNFNDSILSLNDTLFTAILGGETNIVVNNMINVIVRVNRLVESVDFAETSISTDLDSITVNPVVSTTDATNKVVSYKSSDNSIATVDSSGKVAFLKRGTVTITAASTDGSNLSDTISVTSSYGYANSINFTQARYETDYILDKEIVASSITGLSISPSNHDRTVITFEIISGDSVVVEEGKLLIKDGGTSIVKVLATTGDERDNVSTTITILVNRDIESIDIEDDFTITSSTQAGNYYTVYPSTATEQYSFSVDNESLASVSSNGAVTFYAYGSVTVTITSASGNVSETVVITFIPGDASNIEINIDEQEVSVNHVNRFVFTFAIENKEFGVVSYSGYDASILSLDENSNIFTTLKGGKTTILVTNDDGTTININLTVIQDVDSISVTSDDINLNNALIETGKYQVKLNAVANPISATNRVIKFEVDNEDVASIDQNGLITFKKPGTIQVTLTVENPIGNNCVKQYSIASTYGYIRSIDITDSNITKSYDDDSKSFTINYKYQLADADIKNIYFTSTNEEVATVDNLGNVTIVGGGITTITVFAISGIDQDSNPILLEDSVELSVSRKVTNIVINDKISTSNTTKLSPTLEPADHTEQTVTYTTSSSVASVADDGTVTFFKPGVNVDVVITSENGITKTTQVSWIPDNKGIDVSASQSNVDVNYEDSTGWLNFGDRIEGQDYTATVLSVTPASYARRYSSQDPVIEIGEDGYTIKFLKGGSATIEIKYVNKDGVEKVINITIDVIRKAESIEVDSSTDGFVIDQVTGLKEVTLTSSVLPIDTTNKSVTYSSSDLDIATVDQNGKVTFSKEGSVTITVTSNDGSNVYTDVVITSTYGYITSLETNPNLTYIFQENTTNTINLEVSLQPYGALKENLEFVPSNNEVATVSNDGIVTILGGGTTTITIKAYEDSLGNFFETNVSLSVTRYPTGIEVDSISSKNNNIQVTHTILPSDATELDVTYQTVTDIASVNESGIVTFTKPGSVQVIVTTENNISSNATITYVPNDYYHEITSNGQEISVNADGDNKSFWLLFDVLLGLGNYQLSFTDPTSSISTTSDIISISSDGYTLTPLKGGNVTVYAYNLDSSSNPTNVVSVDINVIKKAESIEVDSSTDGFVIDQVTGLKEVTLTSSVLPIDTTNKSVTYSSSDLDIATVDQNGKVTFSKEGSVTITVTSNDGSNVYTDVVITSTYGYITSVEKITADGEEVTDLTINHVYTNSDNSIDLDVTIAPYGANADYLLFESGNRDIATVSSDGVITVVGGGTTTIKIKGYKNSSTIVDLSTITLNVTRYASSISSSDKVISEKGVQLTYSLNPSDITVKDVKFSLDSTIATITNNGYVEFSKPGQVLVLIETIAPTDLIVSKEVLVTYLPEGYILLNPDNLTLDVSYGDQFSIVVPVEFGVGENYSLSIGNTNVLQNNNGVITAIDGGSTTITITGNNVDVTINVNVSRYPINISLSTDDGEIQGDGSILTSKTEIVLNPTLQTGTVTEDNIIYSSNDISVATVDQNGKVTFLKAGKVTITATTKDVKGNDLTATLTIQSTYGSLIDYSISNVSTGVNLDNIDNKTFSIVISNPSPADFDLNNSTTTYSSTVSSVATVSNGVVTVAGKGTTTISVTIGGVTKTFDVTTTIYATDINATYKGSAIDSSKNKVIGTSLQLGYTVTPTDLSNPGVIYSIVSGNATISNTGLVTFTGFGEVVIRVASLDGKSSKDVVLNRPDNVAITSVTIQEDIANGEYYQEKAMLVEASDVGTTKNFLIKVEFEDVLNPEAFDYNYLTFDSSSPNATTTYSVGSAGALEGSITFTGTATSVVEAEISVNTVANSGFVIANEDCNYVTMVYRNIQGITLNDDNSNDGDYGDPEGLNLEQRRVFGTLNASGGAYTYQMALTRNPSTNVDSLQWSVSGDASACGVSVDQNGLVTFNGTTSFTGYKYVTVTVRASDVDSYGFVNAKEISDSYTFTVVYGRNVASESDFTATNNAGAVLVLHSNLILSETYFNGATSTSLNSEVYGNGFYIDFQNLPQNSSNGRSEVYLNNSLHNLTVRGNAIDSTKSSYDSWICFTGDGKTLDYCVIEHYFKGWTSGRTITFNNCLFRHAANTGVQLAKDSETGVLNFNDTIWQEVGMCAIDYQAGTINISGLFDVHNFVAASAFSGMSVSLGSLNIIKVEDYVAEVYNNNPSYVDSNSKANIAIAMVMRTKSESYATVNFVGGTANGSVALPSSSGLTYERLAYSKRVLFSTYYNYFFATKASALSSTTQPAIEKITRSA